MMGALEILKLVGIFIMSPSLERCPNSYCKEISDTEICLGSVRSVDYIFFNVNTRIERKVIEPKCYVMVK